MKRKQIYISEETEDAVKALAIRRGVPEAVIVREALEQYVVKKAKSARKKKTKSNPLDKLVGIIKGGPRDAALNHDFYLYGLPKKG